MYKYITTFAAVFLMVAAAVSANTMLSYAQNASNMTGDVGSNMTGGDVGSNMTGDVKKTCSRWQCNRSYGTR